jgi:hypothetical protein
VALIPVLTPRTPSNFARRSVPIPAVTEALMVVLAVKERFPERVVATP